MESVTMALLILMPGGGAILVAGRAHVMVGRITILAERSDDSYCDAQDGKSRDLVLPYLGGDYVRKCNIRTIGGEQSARANQ